MATLTSLADYAERICWREQRKSVPHRVLLADPQIAASYAEERRSFQERVHELRAWIESGDWQAALDLLGHLFDFSELHFRFLARAFPLMTDAGRGAYLKYVWCQSKARPRSAGALPLFRAAVTLRQTVSADWPTEVRVYRGTWSAKSNPWPHARRMVRRGVAWTSDRAIAMKFATENPGAVGCLGATMVAKAAILAYFHDPDTLVVHGVTFPFDGFHEHECIIDPSTINRVVAYERVDTNSLKGDA